MVKFADLSTVSLNFHFADFFAGIMIKGHTVSMTQVTYAGINSLMEEQKDCLLRHTDTRTDSDPKTKDPKWTSRTIGHTGPK